MAGAQVGADEWPDLLRELRASVFEAGFTDWDAQAIAALDEGEDRDPRTIALGYLDLFLEHLRPGSKQAKDMAFEQLSTLVSGSQDQRVETTILSLSEGPDIDLKTTASTDELIDDLANLKEELLSGYVSDSYSPEPQSEPRP